MQKIKIVANIYIISDKIVNIYRDKLINLSLNHYIFNSFG